MKKKVLTLSLISTAALILAAVFIFTALTDGDNTTTTPQNTSSTDLVERVENRETTLQLSLMGIPWEWTGTYTGEMADGLPHGQGSFTVFGSTTYTGDWNAGHLDGEGRWELIGGSSGTSIMLSEGVYKNDLLTSGKLFRGDGEIYYEGEFRDGLMQNDLQTRIDDYSKAAVPVSDSFANHIGQIVTWEREIAEIRPNAAHYVFEWSGGVTMRYFPAYGEPLPKPGQKLLVYYHVYEKENTDGEKGVYQDFIGYVVQ
jgi:hypothetical protein